MGKYCDLLYSMQQEKRRSHPYRSGYEAHSQTFAPHMAPSFEDYYRLQRSSTFMAGLFILERGAY